MSADPTVVSRLVAALEQASGSLPAEVVPELAQADVRRGVADRLDEAGRTLVRHGADGRTVAFASGYADDIAPRLAAEGLAVLDPLDAAVVALVLLHTVAGPTAEGRPPVPWSAAEGVAYDRLDDTRSGTLTKTAVRDAVNRLHAAGILVNARRYGIRPGPALDRLTDAQRRRIEIRLLALAAPDDPVIAGLLAQLEPGPTAPTHQPSTSQEEPT